MFSFAKHHLVVLAGGLFFLACEPAESPPPLLETEAGLYWIADGSLYKVVDTILVRVTAIHETSPTEPVEFRDTIPQLGLHTSVKLRHAGNNTLRYIVNAVTPDSTPFYTGARDCWETFSPSTSFLLFRLTDADGFALGTVSVAGVSDLINTTSPTGVRYGIRATGSTLLSSADARLISDVEPSWLGCT